jgi:hypothetical protein
VEAFLTGDLHEVPIDKSYEFAFMQGG